MPPPASPPRGLRVPMRGGLSPGCLGLLGIGVLVVLGTLGFGCFGMHLMAEQVGRDLADNPVVREHLGEIREIRLSLGASLEIPAEDVFVFEIEGSTGRGSLEARLITRSADREEVLAGTLTLEDGRSVDLFHDTTPPLDAEDPDQQVPSLQAE